MTQMEIMFPYLTQSDKILNERYTVNVVESALGAALHAMMLGEVEQGNRIVDLLYKHNTFEYSPVSTRVPLNFAWNASDCWPKPYTHPEEGKLLPARGGWDHGPSQIESLKKEKSEQWAKALEKDPLHTEWTFADFSKAYEGAGVEIPSSHEMSVDLALQLGLDDIAGEIIRTNLVDVFSKASDGNGHPRERLEYYEILQSPRIWDVLCDGFVRKELGITREQIREYVDKVLETLETRLTEGAMASLRRESIKSLCHIFDERCLARRELGNRGGNRSYGDEDGDALPKTFLKEPASEAVINESQAKAVENGLSVGFPADYLEFLGITNGIYPPNEPDNPQAIFYPVEKVIQEGEWQMELLPHDSLGFHYDGDFDEWPEFNTWVDIGPGGDEGMQWIVPKAIFKPALDMFEEIYEAASPGDRMRIERAAKDLYGGVEALRKLEVIIIRFYHWGAETEVFKNFKTLLEYTVADVLAEKEKSDAEDDDEEDRDVDAEEDVSGDENEADDNYNEHDPDGDEVTGEDGDEVEDEENLDDDFEDGPADKVKKRRRGTDEALNKRQKPENA